MKTHYEFHVNKVPKTKVVVFIIFLSRYKSHFFYTVFIIHFLNTESVGDRLSFDGHVDVCLPEMCCLRPWSSTHSRSLFINDQENWPFRRTYNYVTTRFVDNVISGRSRSSTGVGFHIETRHRTVSGRYASFRKTISDYSSSEFDTASHLQKPKAVYQTFYSLPTLLKFHFPIL